MKNILISLIIGLFVSTIVAQDTEKTLSLDNTVKRNAFRAKGVYGLRSMANGRNYCTNKRGNIILYSYKTGGLVDTLVKGSELVPDGSEDPISMGSYTFSEDETKVLIPTETESIYRWSSKSNYFIWDIENQRLSALSDGGKQRLADFSPDGSKIAFVRENNLFIKDLASEAETQITTE